MIRVGLKKTELVSGNAGKGETEGGSELATDITYRSSKIYRDPGHLHICSVEVFDSFLSGLIALEANKTHPPFG